MIKLDLNPVSLADTSNLDLTPTRRLLVLIPSDGDYSAATRRIWEIADATNMPVLLLAFCKDTTEEPGLRRSLVTMASLLRDGRRSVEVKVEVGTNWVDLVRCNSQDGDMVVCFGEQRTGFLHRPLTQVLQSNLRLPVYILSGLSPQTPSPSNWRSQTFAWTGSLGIIILFFVLQIRITSLPEDWIQTTLLLLSVIAETVLIGGWNRLIG